MTRVPVKVIVHVLERTVGGLGVEEVDDGQEDEVEAGEDDVEFIAQVADADGGELGADEAEELQDKAVLVLS